MSSVPSQIHGRLVVFLAVARHLSFTQAGLELHITTGTVSQQVKALDMEKLKAEAEAAKNA